MTNDEIDFFDHHLDVSVEFIRHAQDLLRMGKDIMVMECLVKSRNHLDAIITDLYQTIQDDANVVS